MLRKRLGIDELRVALSRPTERLLWLDVNPADSVVRQSLGFLNGSAEQNRVSSCVPAALMKTLEEDELDVEERILRCQQDARQYLQVRPEIAWSRAQQGVMLLGRPGSVGSVEDQAARDAAHLVLAETCFVLGIRNIRLAAELGKPDPFVEAKNAAMQARRFGLASLIEAVGRVQGAAQDQRLQALVEMAQSVPAHKNEMEGWLQLEMSARSRAWLDELEAAVFNAHNASILTKVLPPFYEALDLPDRTARAANLRQRAVQLFTKEKRFGAALAELRALPERQPKLEAACHEGLSDYRAAADCYLLAGDRKEALRCYRTVPDLKAALGLAVEMGGHPATESLAWITKLQTLVSQRPEKFTKVVTAEEKKALEELLERALGVSRRKSALKKPGVKKPPAPRKRTLKN
jgi:tetratricopeptide (TPR) repeat protein